MGKSSGEFTNGNVSVLANLYVDIAADLQRQILDGELAEGQRIMSERMLAERYGVSRNVVREGLCVLTEKGLIEIHPGKGAFVISSHNKATQDIVKAVLNNSTLRWHDMVEARETIELAAVGNAAQRASKADLAKLRELVIQMDMCMEENRIYNMQSAELDAQFHLMLAKASGNQMFEILLNVFYSIFDAKHMLYLSQRYANSMMQTQQEHKAILAAVSERDSQKARDMLRIHLASLRADLSNLQSADLELPRS